MKRQHLLLGVALVVVVAVAAGVWWVRRPSAPGPSPAAPSAAAQRPPAPPLPDYALTIVADEPLFAGDPLIVKVALTSPRARQLRNQRARAGERGQPAPQQQEPAAVAPKAFLSAVTLSVRRTDGAGGEVLASTAADAFRVKLPERTPVFLPVAEWTIPPDALAGLPAGTYEITARWRGPSNAEISGSSGPLTVVSVTDDVSRAVQAERLALAAFARGDAKAGREAAARAVQLDAARFDPRRALVLMRMAEAAEAAGDRAAAIEAYESLRGKLPPPDANDMALDIEARLKRLRAQ